MILRGLIEPLTFPLVPTSHTVSQISVNISHSASKRKKPIDFVTPHLVLLSNQPFKFQETLQYLLSLCFKHTRYCRQSVC